MAKRIITINRMFGSNGRLIGKTLAENLDIGFYDKELIDMAAKKNNIPFDTLAKVDEKKASQWVFPVDSELQFTDNFSFVSSSGNSGVSISDNSLYLFICCSACLAFCKKTGTSEG